MNFDNKNAIKRVTPCKFLCQIIFCNVEFAQNCRKFEFSGGKIEFHGKKSSFAIFGQNEFPSKRTKKEPESALNTLVAKLWNFVTLLLILICFRCHPQRTRFRYFNFLVFGEKLVFQKLKKHVSGLHGLSVLTSFASSAATVEIEAEINENS